MRQVKVFFGNIRKTINTSAVTLEDFITELKNENVFDNSDSHSRLLERYSFMKPNEDGSETELEFQSLSAKIPEESFNIFIVTKKNNFGGIEGDLEYITETVENLETEISEIKEMLEIILSAFENGDFNSFENRVPSNNYKLEQKTFEDLLEQAYNRLKK